MRPVRRSKRGKHFVYNVGDFVEVVRGNDISNGQLIRKLDHIRAGKEEQAVWLVKFGGDEENISEKNLGQVIPIGKTRASKAVINNGKKTEMPISKRSLRSETIHGAREAGASLRESATELASTNSPNVGTRNKKKRSAPEIAASGKHRGRKKKNIKKEEEGEVVNVPSSPNTVAADHEHVKLSSDAAIRRSMRNEFNSMEEENLDDNDVLHGGRMSTRATSRKVENGKDASGNPKTVRKRGEKSHHKGDASLRSKTKLPSEERKSKGKKKSRNGTKRRGTGETVEKVKLLTGTLHLYRGENPRVVFIRRV